MDGGGLLIGKSAGSLAPQCVAMFICCSQNTIVTGVGTVFLMTHANCRNEGITSDVRRLCFDRLLRNETLNYSKATQSFFLW